jgi:hypothetical protein
MAHCTHVFSSVAVSVRAVKRTSICVQSVELCFWYGVSLLVEHGALVM